MKIDIIKMLIIFDEQLPLSNEEEGSYWFKTSRKDNLIITCAISIYESTTAITLYDNSEKAIASLHFKNCSEINVLDEKRKFLEILHNEGNGRCFISLQGNPIFQCTEEK